MNYIDRTTHHKEDFETVLEVLHEIKYTVNDLNDIHSSMRILGLNTAADSILSVILRIEELSEFGGKLYIGDVNKRLKTAEAHLGSALTSVLESTLKG